MSLYSFIFVNTRAFIGELKVTRESDETFISVRPQILPRLGSSEVITSIKSFSTATTTITFKFVAATAQFSEDFDLIIVSCLTSQISKVSQVVYLSSTSRALNPSPQLNEFKYYDVPLSFPKLARIFLLEGYPTIPRKKEKLARHTRNQIVATGRGYDSFST